MTDLHRPHVPQRPIWLCRVCLVAWPCLAARSLLPIQYYADPAGLAIYLATALMDATEDLTALNPNPGPDPVAMHARFVGWVRMRSLITRARLGADAGGNPRRPWGGLLDSSGALAEGRRLPERWSDDRLI